MKWSAIRDVFERIALWSDKHSPQTLFARALIIIVVPMLLLQALSAWWFYSQRGDNVTNRLAILLVRDLRLLISLRSDFPDDEHRNWILRRSAQDLLLFVSFRKGIVRPFKEPEYFDIVARGGAGRARGRPEAALLPRQQYRRRPAPGRDPALRRRRDGRAGPTCA